MPHENGVSISLILDKLLNIFIDNRGETRILGFTHIERFFTPDMYDGQRKISQNLWFDDIFFFVYTIPIGVIEVTKRKEGIIWIQL